MIKPTNNILAPWKSMFLFDIFPRKPPNKNIVVKAIATESGIAKLIEKKPWDERKKGVKQTKAVRAGDTPSTIPAHREAKRLALPITLSFSSISIDFSKLLSFLARAPKRVRLS